MRPAWNPQVLWVTAPKFPGPSGGGVICAGHFCYRLDQAGGEPLNTIRRKGTARPSLLLKEPAALVENAQRSPAAARYALQRITASMCSNPLCGAGWTQGQKGQ